LLEHAWSDPGRVCRRCLGASCPPAACAKDLGTRLDRHEKHIRPLLGARRIASLDIEDLVEWQDGLEEAGVGDPTLIKAIGILSSIFAEAARRGDPSFPIPTQRVRRSVVSRRPGRTTLGRHTHSALMLASGMSLQRLARIQGHGIRVLDETYSEQLAEFAERDERIDPVAEIEAARDLVWAGESP